VSASEHRARAPEQVAVALITVSDSRTLDTDKSGQYLEQALVSAGHHVSGRQIVPDEREALQAALVNAAATAQVIITSGGTGIAGRDITIPLIEHLLTKPMPGFGELFRMLSYEEVGAAAMLSRATAGLARIQGNNTEHNAEYTVLLFALPGSTNAVKTAWTKLLADELPHLVLEMTKA
jgi:molybdenum cofactor biosynthesis protein B